MLKEEPLPPASAAPPPPVRFHDKPEPLLPQSLLGLGIDLSNLVRVCLDETGTVKAQTLLRAAHPLFDGAWLDAASRWRADPFVWEGKPRSVCLHHRNVLKHAYGLAKR